MEGLAQVAVGRGVVRVDPKGGPAFADGPLQVLLVMQGEAQVVVGQDQVGVDLEGGLVFADGPFQVFLVTQGRRPGRSGPERSWGRW